MKKILLVEDEAILALATQHGLEARGYRVETVHRALDAVARATGDPEIDLILMDIDLGPGMDGTEAAQQILATRNLPIVFLSSHTEQSLVDKVRGITRYGYVIKNSGDFVLNASIEMALQLFDAHRREQEHAARYEAVVEAQPDLMFVMGADGVFREAYAPSGVSLAIPADRLRGAHLSELFGEREAARHLAAYRTCLATGQVQALEYELRPAGVPRLFEARISRLGDDTVLAIVREVTESRRVEGALSNLAALQRVVVDIATSCINLPSEAIPDAIQSALTRMARSIGADHAFVVDYDYARETAVTSYEWSAAETASQGETRWTIPLAEMEEGLSLHRQGKPHHLPDVLLLPRGRLRSELEARGIRSLLAVPLLADGACVGAVGFACVREQHEFSPEEHDLLTVFAELFVNLRRREAAEERLRVLFDAARDNILVHEIGPDGQPGKYLDVNRSTCETLGYTREELLAMSPIDTTATCDAASVSTVLGGLKEGESVLIEARGRRKDGTLVPFELNLHRFTLHGRDTVIAISRDISERRNREVR